MPGALYTKHYERRRPKPVAPANAVETRADFGRPTGGVFTAMNALYLSMTNQRLNFVHAQVHPSHTVEVALQRVRAAVARKGTVSPAELTWLIARLRALLDW